MTQIDMFTTDNKTLTRAQRDMLGRMMHALSAMNCKFLVITPEGEKYGNMREDDKPAKGKRRPLKHPFGVKAAYVRPYLETLDVGQVVEIPVEGSDFTATEIVNACSSLACKLWGNGQATTAFNPKTKMVEVLRTGGI